MPSSRRSVKARRATPELPRSRCNDTLPRPSRWIRPARERGELAVGHDLAARYRPQRVDDCSLEGRAPVEVERDARRIDGLTGEEPVDEPAQIRHEAVTTRGGGLG